MKSRVLARALMKAVKTFPAVVVTGPRQSGKTTLLKMLFSKTHRFISLENPDVRMRAKEDPVGFLEEYQPPVIFDEIQYVPELLSYIKTKIDQKRKAGQWLFTGSQHFPLMQGVSQSLAGRTAVFTLLPFSYSERIDNGNKSMPIHDWLKTIARRAASHQTPHKHPPLYEVILRGNYPEIAIKKSVDRQFWCGSYITTYLERDVRNLSQIGDLSQFEQFLKLCAIRTGQILNISEMARSIGISVTTAKKWISILETGYQIYLLPPYYKNLGKRLVKNPKLYFNDTALASYLLGIHTKETLLHSPNFSHLFETFIVNDVLKRFTHHGSLPSLYYLRTRDGLEIDLLLEIEQKLHLFEIKSSATITGKHASSLLKIRHELPALVKTTNIISASPENYPLTKAVRNFSWKNILAL